MKYSVVTFGCRVNQADSLAAEEGLLALGAIPAEAERADVVVVNTCSVTASADQAARQTIRRIARINPAAKIVVTGCYATRRPEDVCGLPNVVRIVANDDKPQLIQLLRSVIGPLSRDASKAPNTRTGDGDGELGEGTDFTTADRVTDGDGACGATIEPGIAGRTAFTLRVQTGCGEQCSYCIIPATRGRPRSVPIDALVADVERVTRAGFKEIALTGVHLGSYGRDLVPSSSLLGLLRELASWASGARAGFLRRDLLFRISSLEPMDCSREIVDLVANEACFAPHFHLPLQHASNGMLMAMRRPYTIEYYRALVEAVRSQIPHASIGSDIIVGFPGESDDDFAQMVAYLESCPLTHIHVFPYSDRPGTVASAMGGKVSGPVVRERARVVRDIGQRLTAAFRESQLGTVHAGLTLDDGSLVVTGNYLKVRIPPGRARNEWVRVKVTGANEILTGNLVIE